MTLTQLRYVIAIADTHSMNEAARTLFIAQPSLSQAIRELEEEIGITIFNRSNRGVMITPEGEEFLGYARAVVDQYRLVEERYIEKKNSKKRFSVSMQHYSFAVKAFVEMVKEFDTSEYEFAIRETKTLEIISDVATLRSEIGIIYLNDFNRQSMTKLLSSNGLKFHALTNCNPFVYIWKGHPLASQKSISFEQLDEFPCLSFEQGDNSSFYLAEEILSTNDYQRIIKANDRATMLNLMIGLNGYTLCSGIICEELNGSDYIAVPFESGNDEVMEIGYITLKNVILSELAETYLAKLKGYLSIQ